MADANPPDNTNKLINFFSHSSSFHNRIYPAVVLRRPSSGIRGQLLWYRRPIGGRADLFEYIFSRYPISAGDSGIEGSADIPGPEAGEVRGGNSPVDTGNACKQA